MTRGGPLVLLLAVAASACGPAGAVPADSLAPLGKGRDAWLEAEIAARRAYGAGRWGEAAAHYERMIGVVPPGPIPEALFRSEQAVLYNLACCRALAGKGPEAFDALESATRDGAAPVGFDHLVEDPDLVPLRGDPRWEALVRRLSWNEEILFASTPEGTTRGAVVVEIREESAFPPGPLPGPVPAARHAVPFPPYLAAPGRYAWTTRLDRGERAAEKAVFALVRAEASFGGPLEERVLLARGKEAVRVAWEVILRRPRVFTRAVFAGPAPPARILLDRGAGKMATEIVVVGGESAPDPAVARVRTAASVEEALR